MNWKDEWKWLAGLMGAFLALFYLPVGIPRFNNAVLGKAKIHFKESDYHKALVTLKAIDTRKDYDRAYHYYYAETSFKLQDYKTASQQYAILLQDKNDRFFITNSVTLIEHKLDLSNRFIEK